YPAVGSFLGFRSFGRPARPARRCTTQPTDDRPGSVPAKAAGRSVILGQARPIGPGQAIELVDNFAVAKRHLASQLLAAAEASAVHIDEPEVSLFKTQNGDVGRRTGREVSQLLLLDLTRRVPGGAQDHLGKRHA